MAYYDSLIPISDATRNSILGNLEWASRFGNQFKENYVTEQEIPERVSRARLGDATNRFNLQNRMNRWDTDLEQQRIDSELGLRTTRYALDDFDEARSAERTLRDLEVRRSQADLSMLEDKTELERTRLQIDRLNNESEIEKRTFDLMRDRVISQIPNYAALSPAQRYDAEIRIANQIQDSTSKNAVIARINKSYVEENNTEFENINQYTRLIEQRKRLIEQGTEPNNPYLKKLNQMIQMSELIIPHEFVLSAAKSGLISLETANQIINGDSEDQPASTGGLEEEVINAPLVDTSPRNNQAPVPQESQEIQQTSIEPDNIGPVYLSSEQLAMDPNRPVSNNSNFMENRNDFPQELRGIIDFNNYTESNYDNERQRLLALVAWAKTTNDELVAAIVSAKAQMFLEIGREAGWIQ